MRKGPSSGSLRTLRRAAGRPSINAVELALTGGGAPAVILFCELGPYEPRLIDGQSWWQNVRLTFCCCCSSYQSVPVRGEDAETLIDEVLYRAVRAVAALDGITRVRPQMAQWMDSSAEHDVLSLSIDATRSVDVYDDTTTLPTITDVGIVQNPTDPTDLFEADNTTPKCDEPGTGGSGVVTL